MHLTTTERVVILYITAVTAVSGLFRGEPTETIGDDCHSVLQSQKSQGCSEKNLQRQLETTVILYCSHSSLRVVQRRTYRDNWRRLSFCTAVTAVSGLFRGEPTETIGDDCHCVLSHRSLRVVQRRTYRDNWRRLSFCTAVTEVSGLFREEPTETIGDDCHSVL